MSQISILKLDYESKLENRNPISSTERSFQQNVEVN